MTIRPDTATSPSFFRLASERMDWLAERQKVLAANIANADTPGYRARDLTAFEDFLSTGVAESRETGSVWDVSADDNRVVLEEQSLLASETEESHRLAARLYRRGHDLIALAVGK
ncbi:flagellar basal body rod protein FlgB [Falsigemmobacter faecalis]|uniref:Flagellar biosynthesis protein FlgB n=1 Tax=Falsigemmobacter faecalis TaxID=2488730 RepID=A0A3P3DSZ3_9RHOB|nr:flagellar basal body protein [Falsigemmobacter faecalis]RRH75798.1 flagellar biosynthesis protein FlgB [Falsigemmobacter faecalis]